MKKEGQNGIKYIFLAAAMWSTGGLLVKFIPWGALTIACIRSLIAAAVILLYTRDFKLELTKNNLAGGLFCCLTNVGFILANKMTTAANAIVLHYSMPVFVIIFSAILFRQRPKRLEGITVILTFLGIFLCFANHFGKGALAGDLIAVGSGATYAMFIIMNNRPETNTLHLTVIGCVMTALLLPFVFTDPGLSADPKAWLAIIALGAFQHGLSYAVFARGIKTTTAVSASIITMTEPILNPVWVFLALGERPGGLAVIGSVIVLSTVTAYTLISARRRQMQGEQSSTG